MTLDFILRKNRINFIFLSNYISEIDPDTAETFAGNNSTGYTDLTLKTLSSLHGESSATVDSYLVMLNYNNKNITRQVASITFDEEILGVFVSSWYTHDTTSGNSTADSINNLYSS